MICSGDHEVRCVKRKLLLEALEKELPSDTIKYSSKVISIENSGFFKGCASCGWAYPQNQGTFDMVIHIDIYMSVIHVPCECFPFRK